MIARACISWGLATVSGLLCLAGIASGGITITPSPTFYKPGNTFDIRCDLGGNPGNIADVLAISIGLVVNRVDEKILAGISNTELPQVISTLRTRAYASGGLNHTHVTESYLTMHMNNTNCSDVGEYYCKMNVHKGILVLADKNVFNYTIAAGEESKCQVTTTSPVTTDPTASKGSGSRQAILTVALCVMAISVLRMRH